VLSGVLDANGVIGPAKGGVFDLLAQIFSPLYVPPAVIEEVVVQGSGRPGAAELSRALGVWVTELKPSSTALALFTHSLPSIADCEVLAVAQEQAVDYILSDDWSVLQEARRHRLSCLQAPGVVVLMKRVGLLPHVRPVLDRMRQEGFGIPEDVFQAALSAAGE
jgi:predicted nucleic acid-binding protein